MNTIKTVQTSRAGTIEVACDDPQGWEFGVGGGRPRRGGGPPFAVGRRAAAGVRGALPRMNVIGEKTGETRSVVWYARNRNEEISP